MQHHHLEQALAGFDRAIAHNPTHLNALIIRGNLLMERKQWEAAKASYEQALTLKPDYAEVYSNLGNALKGLKRFDAALDSYDQAIALKPDYAEAHSNRADLLVECNRLEDALRSYDRAIALKPDYADAWSNRGLALQKHHRLQEAVHSFDHAIALDPLHFDAWSNRGLALHALQQPKKAVVSYDRAIALKPDFGDAWFNQALALLLDGQFRQGWQLYEWRWKCPDGLKPRPFLQPVWLGAGKLQGKTILLHGEQGLGDSIQFCRYAKWVKQLGATVLLEVPRQLTALLAELEGVDAVLEQGQALPAFDCHCPLLSLPLAFKTDLHTIPNVGPYLQSSASKRRQWSQRLGEKTKPRVGLVWRGSTVHKNDQNRSLPLAAWLPHLPGICDYVSLQKEVRTEDLELLHTRSIRHFGEALQDFSDTAALCDLVDMVLSVDTSVAHLAAAMGKPTWVLLPFTPDWRWLLERDDSPWYSSVRLYRQAALGQWEVVLERVEHDLLQHAALPDRPLPPAPTPAVAALFQHAVQLHQQGHLVEAKAAYEAVLKIQPAHADAHAKRGLVLLKLAQWEEAMGSLDQAIALNPEHADAHLLRGNVFMECKQWEEALACFNRVLALKPDYAGAWCNHGIALLEQNQLDAAIASCERAIALNPELANAHHNKSIALLLGGQLQQGWELYEWRWKADLGLLQRPFSQPQWSGAENLADKTILLHGEQGLGDSIQFCRYASLVQQRGARVLLEVPQPLMGLLAQLEGVDQLLEYGKALPAFDYHCPLMSLPRAFKTALHSIPHAAAYLCSDVEKRSQWSQRLGEKTRPRVGLAWRGSTVHKADASRSLPLAELLSHLPAGLDYVSLQKELQSADQQPVRTSAIRHFGEQLQDFTDTAALCDLMDIVLSVDTSVAHLAAAMGKPTWILLPYVPDWRWLLERSDSPWYPSARLYRQSQRGAWGPVLERVGRDVAGWRIEELAATLVVDQGEAGVRSEE
ncbi:MAG: tetratricopeptide repeat protein [Rhodoferax sp.]|nr:tetratricopeptide repeat protein [Rhodoferax sp.]